MSETPEALWIAFPRGQAARPVYRIFRTRHAARVFVAGKPKQVGREWVVVRAQWGPES